MKKNDKKEQMLDKTEDVVEKDRWLNKK